MQHFRDNEKKQMKMTVSRPFCVLFLPNFLIFYPCVSPYSSHKVQPCTKKMKKSEENYYEEKAFFIGRKKKTFSSSFVIDATDLQLIKTIKLNYIFRLFVVF